GSLKHVFKRRRLNTYLSGASPVFSLSRDHLTACWWSSAHERISATCATAPVLLQPPPFGVEGLAAPAERPNLGSADRRQIRPPAPHVVGLDVAGAGDGESAEQRQVKCLTVETP